jgi:hypothetical protein
MAAAARVGRDRVQLPCHLALQVMALGTAAFKYLSQLTCCAAAGGSGGSLHLELSLLRLQKALLGALEGLAGLKPGGAGSTQAGAAAGEGSTAAAEKLAALRGSLSRAAGTALEEEWLEQQDGAAGEGQAAEAAKGEASQACAAVDRHLAWQELPPRCCGSRPGTWPRTAAHVCPHLASQCEATCSMLVSAKLKTRHTSLIILLLLPRSSFQLEGPGRCYQRAAGAARQLCRGAPVHAAAPRQRGAAAGACQGCQGAAAGCAGRLCCPQLLHAARVVQGPSGAGGGTVGGPGCQGGQGRRGPGRGAGGGLVVCRCPAQLR